MEIHALHALLRLDADQRRARGGQRELPLLDEPEVGAPDRSEEIGVTPSLEDAAAPSAVLTRDGQLTRLARRSAGC